LSEKFLFFYRRWFFDNNPNWIQNRDTFWLLVEGNRTLLRPLILCTALAQASATTRNTVLNWITDVTAPIERLLGKSRMDWIHSLFHGAGLLNNAQIMNELFNRVPEVKQNEERVQTLLKEFIRKNKPESVLYLMGPLRDYNQELEEACSNKHREIVSILLKEGRANPAYQYSLSLRKACNVGDPEIVRMLLFDNRVKISDRNYEALEEVMLYNIDKDIIGMLLDHEDIPKNILLQFISRVKDLDLQRWIKERANIE